MASLKEQIVSALLNNRIPAEWKGRVGVHAGFIPTLQAQGDVSSMSSEQIENAYDEWRESFVAACEAANENKVKERERAAKRAQRQADKQAKLRREAAKLGLVVAQLRETASGSDE